MVLIRDRVSRKVTGNVQAGADSARSVVGNRHRCMFEAELMFPITRDLRKPFVLSGLRQQRSEETC